jgi:hypothetical protein
MPPTYDAPPPLWPTDAALSQSGLTRVTGLTGVKRLLTTTVPEWPRSAWLAVCDRERGDVTVFVGPRVEVGDGWLCEGIWDAPYVEGDLDRTDLVFGSGVRLRGDSVVFVSSGTTVDRLHALERECEHYVSNSLPCLLAATGGSLELSFDRYGRIGRSIVMGLDSYERELPTTAGPVQLTYFNNLSWDGRKLSQVRKPVTHRDFTSYEAYRNFLDGALQRLVTNALAHERRSPLELITTLSSGYDSVTAAVLASQVGCRHAFGFDRARGNRDDSGAQIANRIGLRYNAIQTDAWRRHPMAAVPFLAAITSFGSSVAFRGAEELMAGRVVFTGFHGDKVWGTKTHTLGADIVRSDASGTDLSEYRLWVGFVHCAVPFLGVRQIKEIHAISTSPDLATWDIGGGYSRPVCRRIVEECGVPRDMFGVEKKATAQFILGPQSFLTRGMRLDYYRWLWSQRQVWVSRGQKPPSLLSDLQTVVRFRVGMLAGRLARTNVAHRLGPRVGAVLTRLSVDSTSSRFRILGTFVFHWAVDRAKERYRDPRAT